MRCAHRAELCWVQAQSLLASWSDLHEPSLLQLAMPSRRGQEALTGRCPDDNDWREHLKLLGISMCIIERRWQ